MASGNTCRIVVGRLVEIDVRGGYRTVADVDDMIQRIKETFDMVPEPTRLVSAADWRSCRVLTQDVSERAVAMLVSMNPRVERGAILHDSTQATSVLQVARIVREANLTNRRVFTDPFEMERWLGEVLNEAERQRLAMLMHRRVSGQRTLG